MRPRARCIYNEIVLARYRARRQRARANTRERARRARDLLLAKAPDASITLTKGLNGVFDIIVDGAVRYSKHKTGRFPSDSEVEAVLPG